MNSVLPLAIRYLRFNKIKTVILIFSVAVAVFLPLAVNLLVRDYQHDLLARGHRRRPLVAGLASRRKPVPGSGHGRGSISAASRRTTSDHGRRRRD